MELTLDEWMEQVDKLMTARWGFSVHDLPDMPFWDMHNDGLTPKQFFKECLSTERKVKELVYG